MEIDQNQAASEIGAEDEKISILEEQDKDEEGEEVEGKRIETQQERAPALSIGLNNFFSISN